MTNARILVVDDENDIRELVRDILSEEGYVVETAANAIEARAACGRQAPDLVLLDIWMPDTDGISLLREWQQSQGLTAPVVMMSGHGTVETAVEATRLGAVDYVEKPLSLAKLLRTVQRALDEGKRRTRATRTLVPPLIAPVGRSRLMRDLREQVKQIAPHDASVLVLGEPGTGREAFARYIHALSSRSAGPFVGVVAGSITDGNAEEVLLGNTESAASGGASTPGVLEQAQGGVLFINGLEDLLPGAQRLLLAALETGTFMRKGGLVPIAFDVRILSSAQPGFETRGTVPFRLDLLSNLNVLTLRIPPLREYAEDVPELLRYYVDRLVDDEHLPFRRFGVAAQNRLRNYPWPGNIRELKNLVHRLLIQGGPEEIRLEEIEQQIASQAPVDEPLVKQDLLALPLREAREHFERAYLTQQLQLCNGKVGQLAKRVGMERTHLYRKLRSLGVDFRQSED
ncbi:MAG TPA: sigma-54 dependent transcriptional regulator [Steroidobacteraceae bacterium]|nr:sigma-54 dependent transcriptional regulator [Steroidobacteraceae bacterium]